jgi:hypothetical protein
MQNIKSYFQGNHYSIIYSEIRREQLKKERSKPKVKDNRPELVRIFSKP